MAELSITIDELGNNELEEYLMSLKGILDVIIKNDDFLEIYIKYNPNLITSKIIRKEILLFLNILKLPSIIAFDKHPNIKTKEYLIHKDNICCEHCFKSTIENLFEIEGIEKVESNFNDPNSFQKNIMIKIIYNPNLISDENIKKIGSNLNL